MIYLDNAATTKTAPEVVEAMLPYFSEYYGNPSSIYAIAGKSKEAITKGREQIAEYKRRRRTVQFGTYYRLADSFQENQSAWNIVSEDGMEVIFTHVQILARSAYRVPVIRLKGLDPDAVYTDCETGQEYGGDELMYAGIRIPRIRQDFSSTTMVLRKS